MYQDHLTFFIIKEAPNEFFSDMTVVDLCLPFPKSPISRPYDEWLKSYGS
jgi:hypothetical protein